MRNAHLLRSMVYQIKSINHTEMLITDTEFKKNIRQSVKALESPSYNKNNPSYYMINKLMRERGTIITYSGDGGDEMYTGYCTHDRYKTQQCPFLAHFEAIAWKGFKRLQLNLNGHGKRPGDKTRDGRPKEYCRYMESWFPTQIFGNDFLNNCLAVEMLTRVSDDFLTRNDRFGAHFGMEGRFPLLNNTFYYYIMGIPSSVKMNNLNPNKHTRGTYKFVAREGLKDVLPGYIINKNKTGWAIPIHLWLAEERPLNTVDNIQIDSGIEKLIDWTTVSGKTKLSMDYFREWANIYNVTL
jgi:asparagine synthetase B (glutamine-hydrolysing)